MVTLLAPWIVTLPRGVLRSPEPTRCYGVTLTEVARRPASETTRGVELGPSSVVPTLMPTRLTIPFALLLAACGAATPRPAVPGSDVVTLEEMRIVASHEDGQVVFDSYDAGQLFERGTRLLNEGQCRRAVDDYYERIAREFPSSRYLTPALYNAGLCLQQSGELEEAVPYYQRVLEAAPASRDAKHASFQLAQVQGELERFDDALSLTDHLLLREDLSSGERLEGMARRAQALLGLERLDDAERQSRDALSYYRTRQGDARIDNPYFAAAANFVLAETFRQRSEHIPVPEGDANEQHEALEARARLILDAQREYFSTIRFTDPHWAAAAGYRIGSMYDHLWQAMMSAPVPPPTEEMNDATRGLYAEEYREELARHIRPLLRSAIRYWEMTLMMIERTGAETEWAARARTDSRADARSSPSGGSSRRGWGRGPRSDQRPRDSSVPVRGCSVRGRGRASRARDVGRSRGRRNAREAPPAAGLGGPIAPRFGGLAGRYGSSLTVRRSPRT